MINKIYKLPQGREISRAISVLVKERRFDFRSRLLVSTAFCGRHRSMDLLGDQHSFREAVQKNPAAMTLINNYY